MGYITAAAVNVAGLADSALQAAVAMAYDGDMLTNISKGNIIYTYGYDGYKSARKFS